MTRSLPWTYPEYEYLIVKVNTRPRHEDPVESPQQPRSTKSNRPRDDGMNRHLALAVSSFSSSGGNQGPKKPQPRDGETGKGRAGPQPRDDGSNGVFSSQGDQDGKGGSEGRGATPPREAGSQRRRGCRHPVPRDSGF